MAEPLPFDYPNSIRPRERHLPLLANSYAAKSQSAERRAIGEDALATVRDALDRSNRNLRASMELLLRQAGPPDLLR
jgi:hypothetical protein